MLCYILTDAAIQQVQLLDMAGKLVKSFAPAFNNRYNIRDVKPGVYILRIAANGANEVVKVVIGNQ